MLERKIHWRPYISLQSFRFHTLCKELDFGFRYCLQKWGSAPLNCCQLDFVLTEHSQQWTGTAFLSCTYMGCYSREWLCLYLLSKWKVSISSLHCWRVSNQVENSSLGMIQLTNQNWKQHTGYLDCQFRPLSFAYNPISDFYFIQRSNLAKRGRKNQRTSHFVSLTRTNLFTLSTLGWTLAHI